MVDVGVGNNGVETSQNEFKDQRMVYFVLTYCVGCELYALQVMSPFNHKI